MVSKCSGIKSFPYHFNKLDDKNKSIWPSPTLLIKVFYYDLQGQEYLSEKKCFFDISLDEKEGKFKIILLNMDAHSFTNVKMLRKGAIAKYHNKIRTKRYSSFHGNIYKKNDLIFLIAEK